MVPSTLPESMRGAHMRYTRSMTHATLLSDLIDLTTALKTDNATDLEQRKQRDRAIGKTLQAQRKHPARQLRGWLERVEIRGWQRRGQAGVQLYHVLGVVLAVAGLSAGWGLAGALLHYTGATPINVFHALGVLVLAQIALLVLWALSMLPVTLPWFAGLRSALGFLHPGRLARWIAGRFPQRGGSALEVVWHGDNLMVTAPAARWLLSFWSQLFSFWFNLGVLAAVFYLIAFSDLAFAWSTTLKLSDADFHGLLRVLSWPWHNLVPAAVPSRELVEASRYYRLDAGPLGGGAKLSGAQLGGWWPFLVAAVVCYGLVPRLLTLLISWQRTRHHLARALPRLPGAPELLARLNSPLVTTAAGGAQERAAVRPVAPEEAGPRSALAPVPCTIVGWSDTLDHRAALGGGLQALGIQPRDWLSAGGGRSTQQDRETVAALCQHAAEGVAVVTKAWEPPLLEFLDFLQALRAQCTRHQPILVLLWGAGDGVSRAQSDTWRQTLRQLKDPDLHLEVLGAAR